MVARDATRRDGSEALSFLLRFLANFKYDFDARLVPSIQFTDAMKRQYQISRESVIDKNGAVSMIRIREKIESMTKEVGLIDAPGVTRTIPVLVFPIHCPFTS
ncbi:hypothetical protein L2E82_03473 [Cichorium intybus]|uniref:Uncharacterized protein n=1 Tax=Cichorium intybus TaxID=13427 RepID=A0ACB9H594_CICIN|nr:hypothetical protein L2E82_03473 [Cichorium intybus]